MTPADYCIENENLIKDVFNVHDIVLKDWG